MLNVTRTYPRLWSIDCGRVMVVTDLHGDWDAYQRYRDRFLQLRHRNEADCLIICGDLIHADPANNDKSLEMVIDVMRLQQELGDAIIYLCGNHELPHIYGFGLSRGSIEYTPPFERALSDSGHRRAVTELLHSLPLFARTRAGISMTHAGAADVMHDAEAALELFNWNHQQQLLDAELRLEGEDVEGLQEAYAKMSRAPSYEALARHYLAVEGPDDPRYRDLLRGSIAIAGSAFSRLYDTLFSRCEHGYGERYSRLLGQLLRNLSAGYIRQNFLVAGHMGVRGGHEIVAGRHLRLASASHATPRESGLYLLFDAAEPVATAQELERCLHSVF